MDSPNPVATSRTMSAGMLAGADCIDDLDLQRSGGLVRVLGPMRAVSHAGLAPVLAGVRRTSFVRIIN